MQPNHKFVYNLNYKFTLVSLRLNSTMCIKFVNYVSTVIDGKLGNFSCPANFLNKRFTSIFHIQAHRHSTPMTETRHKLPIPTLPTQKNETLSSAYEIIIWYLLRVCFTKYTIASEISHEPNFMKTKSMSYPSFSISS